MWRPPPRSSEAERKRCRKYTPAARQHTMDFRSSVPKKFLRNLGAYPGSFSFCLTLTLTLSIKNTEGISMKWVKLLIDPLQFNTGDREDMVTVIETLIARGMTGHVTQCQRNRETHLMTGKDRTRMMVGTMLPSRLIVLQDNKAPPHHKTMPHSRIIIQRDSRAIPPHKTSIQQGNKDLHHTITRVLCKVMQEIIPLNSVTAQQVEGIIPKQGETIIKHHLIREISTKASKGILALRNREVSLQVSLAAIGTQVPLVVLATGRDPLLVMDREVLVLHLVKIFRQRRTEVVYKNNQTLILLDLSETARDSTEVCRVMKAKQSS